MKKKLYLIFLLSSFICFGQEKIIEILKKKVKLSPIEGIIYADSLLKHSKTINKKDIAIIKYYKANAYKDNRYHLIALKLYNEVLPLFKENDSVYVNILISQANLKVHLKKNSEATELVHEALVVSKKNNISTLIAKAYSAIAHIYYSTKNYQKSLEYQLISLEEQKKGGNNTLLVEAYSNLGLVYIEIGEYTKAIDACLKSLSIDVDFKNNIYIGRSYCNIANSYALMNMKKKALTYYSKAINHNTRSKILNSKPFESRGNFYHQVGDYRAAELDYLKSLNIELKKKNSHIIAKNYTNLFLNSVHQKDIKKILFYKIKYDSIIEINQKQQGKEVDKMLENQYKHLNSVDEMIQAEKINLKNKVIFIISFLFLLFVLILILINNKNTKLKLSQEKLVLEQTVLRSQMNPHFIFNTLAAIQSTILNEEPIKSAFYISKFAKLIRQNFDFVNRNTISLACEIDALQNYMDTQKFRFIDKFDYEIIVSNNIDINEIKIPPLLIQPFVENAIVHGFKNKKNIGKITISISRKNDFICYKIEDNGVGISTKTIRKHDSLHAIDVFKKRIKLLKNKDEKSFSMKSSNQGTIIKFSLKLC